MILSPASTWILPPQNLRLRLRARKGLFPNTYIACSKISSTDQIRSELDQLHVEADQTRAKVNNSRLRLMRLTEAAENLRRQAAVEVRVGKEDAARELLVQKRKVMQALEKSKSRVELLDKLSAKLNEAISLKETQLIGNVALDLEISKDDTSSPIRIVSPREDIAECSKEGEGLEPNGKKLSQVQEFEFQKECQENLYADNQQKDGEGVLSDVFLDENEKVQSLKDITSYENFLESLDEQFHEVEAELATILRLSTLVMENDQRQKNPKIQQMTEILEGVRGIRARIANIMQTKTDDS